VNHVGEIGREPSGEGDGGQSVLEWAAVLGDLDTWQAHFANRGVAFSPVVHREYGSVLTFKDPDGIHFEMFHRVDHP